MQGTNVVQIHTTMAVGTYGTVCMCELPELCVNLRSCVNVPSCVKLRGCVERNKLLILNGLVLLSCTCLKMHGRDGEKIPLNCLRSEFAAKYGSQMH